MFVSRDVVFVENTFPMNSGEFIDVHKRHLNETSDFGEELEVVTDEVINEVSEVDDEVVVPDLATEHVTTGTVLETINHETEIDELLSDVEELSEQDEDHDGVVDDTQEFGPGKRPKVLPARLKDYVLQVVCDTEKKDGEASDDIEFPISKYIDCSQFSPKYRSFLASIIAGTEPTTFRDAVAYKEWREAMQKEIDALEKNKTWTVTTLPPGKKAIGCKWIYKLKYHADGTLERHKARLVVLGNNQKEGVDYDETFAPVVKMTTVRTFLEVAAAKQWELHQMDVNNAFLHGELEEEVYMQLPPGFRNGEDRNSVCLLKKSLYGLKQAPRCWFAKLKGALTHYGFKESHADYSMFYIREGTSEIYVLVYVDDLIIGGNDTAGIAKFKKYLGECFHMKDLGSLKYFLGIEVARNNDGIFLCQRKYTLDIINEVGYLGSQPVAFPIEQQHKLALADGPLLDEPEKYRRLVGRLVYLLATRPDLTYAIHVLSQFMQSPRIDHWRCALRVVRYLKGTPGQGILLNASSDLKLHGWCDSDWAGCPLSRRSVSGWIVMLGSSPISWKTKKQKVAARSSAEAEYRCMALTVKELEWLRHLVADFGVSQTEPTDLHCDNQAALHIAANPVFHERTKGVEIDCHNVRDAIQSGAIRTKKVHTKEQLADVFTKALGRREFEDIVAKLGTWNPHAQLEGGC